MSNTLSHHAYLILGEKQTAENFILDFFKSNKINKEGNPDIFVFDHDRMYIEDARSLVSIENRAPVSLDFKYITLHVGSIVWEAQNALLKLFEEPGRTKFFIVSESKSLFLPTLLSRFEIIDLGNREENKKSQAKIGKKFLELSLKDRLKEISVLCEEISDGKKRKSEARKLLLSLRESLKGSDGEKLKAVLSSLKYISDTSSSTKLLLESVALSL